MNLRVTSPQLMSGVSGRDGNQSATASVDEETLATHATKCQRGRTVMRGLQAEVPEGRQGAAICGKAQRNQPENPQGVRPSSYH